jgi:hypothetical protein
MVDRKLLRDLRRMAGQVVTIAIVIGCGIAILVAAVATYQSLLATQQGYYERGRFAQVFATAKRAPEALAARLAAIPGIGVLETRVVEDVTITLSHSGEPLTAHIVSLPDSGEPLLNRLYLRQGRPIEPNITDEVLVGEAFANANHLHPGGILTAILNGRLEALRVVGIVLSPEYVFATRPGDPIPDDARYGVMWMARKGLAAAFNMEGAFNDITATLAPGADQAAVLDAIDQLLEPYGGLVGYGRHDQPSHRFLTDEIAQQGVMATTMPTVFLAVAVFLLHGMLGRLVGTQREQVATLKALGYPNRSIARHYVKFALAIVSLGGAFGLASGLWFGRLMVENYTRFFRFPQLAFEISPWVVVLALGMSLVAGPGRRLERGPLGDGARTGRGDAPAGTAALPPRHAGAPHLGAAHPATRPDGAAPAHGSAHTHSVHHRRHCALRSNHRHEPVLAGRTRRDDQCTVLRRRSLRCHDKLHQPGTRSCGTRDRPSARRAASRGVSHCPGRTARRHPHLSDRNYWLASQTYAAPVGRQSDACPPPTARWPVAVAAPRPPARTATRRPSVSGGA